MRPVSYILSLKDLFFHNSNQDPVLGEDIATLVIRNSPQLTEQDLRMFLLDRLARFKIPRQIYFVDAIPRNPTGKPLRRVGTERYS
ncbi:MAG: hypothetical protein WC379_12935 [Methanoregula sp.]